jgi:hypothetical protein
MRTDRHGELVGKLQFQIVVGSAEYVLNVKYVLLLILIFWNTFKTKFYKRNDFLNQAASVVCNSLSYNSVVKQVNE